MEEKKLIELLRHAFQWGRDNGSNRSEKNFNDFLETRTVQEALNMLNKIEEQEKEVNITQIRVEKWDGHKYTPIMSFGYKEKTPLVQLLIDMIVTIVRKEGYNHIYEQETKNL